MKSFFSLHLLTFLRTQDPDLNQKPHFTPPFKIEKLLTCLLSSIL